MTDERPSDRDPELARRTRLWHTILFVMASLLSLPAAFVFFVLTVVLKDLGLDALSAQDRMQLTTAVAASLTGVTAWIALGLLFLRPADPRLHRMTWALTAAFGICALPCAGYWLLNTPEDVWMQVVLATVLACGTVSLIAGNHFYHLACQSLALRRALASPASADQKGARP